MSSSHCSFVLLLPLARWFARPVGRSVNQPATRSHVLPHGQSVNPTIGAFSLSLSCCSWLPLFGGTAVVVTRTSTVDCGLLFATPIPPFALRPKIFAGTMNNVGFFGSLPIFSRKWPLFCPANVAGTFFQNHLSATPRFLPNACVTSMSACLSVPDGTTCVRRQLGKHDVREEQTKADDLVTDQRRW